MPKTPKTILMNFLMICALLAVSVSPACKFRSGEAFLMEICTAFGLKTIAVPQNGSAPAGDQNHAKSPCMFCIAGHIHQAVLSDSSILVLSYPQSFSRFWQENSIFQRHKSHDYDSTGPPVTS